jgi:hypothetical protein
MTIDREARAKARNPNYRQGSESTVEQPEEVTAPEIPDFEESSVTVGKSGTRVKSKQEARGEKFQKSRELLERLSRDALQRPKSTRCADREWFEENRLSVQPMVPYGIGLDKHKNQ